MQRAAEARTSTKVSSISRMTIRIIFAGSSDRSSISVMFAAKMSRVREKILIQSLRNRKIRALNLLLPIQEPCQFRGKHELRRFHLFSLVKIAQKPCQMVGFATNTRADFERKIHGAGRPIHRPESCVSRRRRAREPGCAAQPA